MTEDSAQTQAALSGDVNRRQPLQEHSVGHDARVLLFRFFLLHLLGLLLPLLGAAVLDIHRGHLRLALVDEIARRRESRLGDALQQEAAREQRFNYFCQRLAQTLHRLLVVALYGLRQRQRLVQDVAELSVKIRAAALHAFQKLLFVQLFNTHPAYRHSPLRCHLANLLPQFLQRLLVQVRHVCESIVEVLDEQSAEVFLLIDDGGEVEQIEQQAPIELLLQHWQLGDALPGCFLLIIDVLAHALVVDDSSCLDGRGQLQAFQRATAAQRHVHLPGSKRLVSIDDGMLERQSLALVNCDGPCQPQRQLSEGALNVGFQLARLGIQRVFRVLPRLRLHLNLVIIALASHEHSGGVSLADNHRHLGDTAVVVAVFARRVVLHKHHLRTYLQRELFSGGVGVVGESAVHLRLEGERLRRQLREPFFVDAVGGCVVRAEAYGTFLHVSCRRQSTVQHC